MITSKKLVKKFKSGDGEQTVLHGVDLKILSGEFVSIIGPSGAGKSTLMYQLSLLDEPSSGEIMIDGIDTHTLSDEQRTKFRLQNLGYVFQDYALLPEMTALENVAVPILMQGFSKESAYAKARETLEAVGLSAHAHKVPAMMSGGQQQRVSIARAIAHNPKILFADEPTANLDSESSREVLKVFLDLNAAGQTIVMVTHEMEFAQMTQRIIHMRDGVVLEDKKLVKTVAA